jgi:hypothetical protein
MLPTHKRKPKSRIEDFNILIYGAPKIGKSSFASQADSPVFISTESGLNALEVFEIPTPNWTTFLTACRELSTKPHSFKTVVVDTIDNLYKLCVEHIRNVHQVEHEGDLAYGKGYSLIRDEFMRALRALSMLPTGLILISHVNYEEIKTRTSVYNKAVPTVPKSVRDALLGWVDIIMYADITPEGERVLHIKSDDKYISGDRTASIYGAFDTPSPLEFTEFSKCFYNRKGGK